ncbi:TetR/AcrR family transcriptional regulator [Arenibacter algicola]|jgi:AcrR family transcriptional regulator|uniref:TetR/AcrR family transcriptional regulator n=1 Tax=Arenibacter algicola TaxID=616991 RepID=UPI001C07182B|nr:TetR/AcrR family transcriptional regulator [Arenibacter algicola]MBU2905197.1 TetR/AcrR family transcriptional regulator [Arenibacter algicola]
MTRKRYQGEINDKERSKQKLIKAVGTVLKNKGYTGLTATNIAKAAGLSRRLITVYFSSVDELVETYVRNKDFWLAASGNAAEMIAANKGEDTKKIIEYLLQNQIDNFYDNPEMQKLILWEISKKTKIMYEVCEEREHLGSKVFELTDKELQGRNIDIRAVTALLVAGIYYMVLHAKSTDTTFCEIDINQPEGMQRIKNAISLILENTYKN